MVLGTVVRPHGVRGTVLVHMEPSAYASLREGLDVALVRDKTPELRTRIMRVARHRTGAALDLQGITNRDEAVALAGCRLVTERRELPATSADEFYACDVLGCEVVGPDGERLGRVTEIVTTGANDVWIVRGERGELLVPAVSHAVLDVRMAERTIVIDPAAAVGDTGAA